MTPSLLSIDCRPLAADPCSAGSRGGTETRSTVTASHAEGAEAAERSTVIPSAAKDLFCRTRSGAGEPTRSLTALGMTSHAAPLRSLAGTQPRSMPFSAAPRLRVSSRVALVVIGALALVCGVRVGGAQAVAKPGAQRVSVARAVAADASIRLMGSFASLRVVAWEHDSLSITGQLPAGARFDGGVMAATGGERSRGAKYFVEAPTEAAAGGALELRVPARARLWIKAGSATISVVGVTGGLDLNIVGGAIQVTGNPRELRAESMDGAVTVDGAPTWVRVKTASGDVELRGGAGGSEDAGLQTVSGTVRVSGGRYERLRLESVTGPVRFAAGLARGASLDVDTHSGVVELAVDPKALAAEVDLLTVAGTIENRVLGRKPVAGREGRGQELGFTVGAGSARVMVRTFKGTIRLLPASLPPRGD